MTPVTGGPGLTSTLKWNNSRMKRTRVAIAAIDAVHRTATLAGVFLFTLAVTGTGLHASHVQTVDIRFSVSSGSGVTAPTAELPSR